MMEFTLGLSEPIRVDEKYTQHKDTCCNGGRSHPRPLHLRPKLAI